MARSVLDGVRAGDWFAVLFLLAIVYVLVRPASQAAKLVDALGAAAVAVVRRATDIGNI